MIFRLWNPCRVRVSSKASSVSLLLRKNTTEPWFCQWIQPLKLPTSCSSILVTRSTFRSVRWVPKLYGESINSWRSFWLSQFFYFQLMKLPDHLAIYPAQIAECCLYEGDGFENEEEFSTNILNVDQIVKVMDVVDNKWVIDKSRFLNENCSSYLKFDERICSICSPDYTWFYTTLKVSAIRIRLRSRKPFRLCARFPY